MLWRSHETRIRLISDVCVVINEIVVVAAILTAPYIVNEIRMGHVCPAVSHGNDDRWKARCHT